MANAADAMKAAEAAKTKKRLSERLAKYEKSTQAMTDAKNAAARLTRIVAQLSKDASELDKP
jgi:hypothetical protein